MAVPKKKTSKSRTRRRHTMYVTKQRTKLSRRVTLTDCPQCGSKKRAHHVCPECGYYKGVQVIDKTAKAGKITRISA